MLRLTPERGRSPVPSTKLAVPFPNACKNKALSYFYRKFSLQLWVVQAFNHYNLFKCSLKHEITGGCLCRTNYTFFKHVVMNPSVVLLVIFFRKLHLASVVLSMDIHNRMGKEWDKKHLKRVKNSTEKGARCQHLSCCQQWREVGSRYNHAFLD